MSIISNIISRGIGDEPPYVSVFGPILRLENASEDLIAQIKYPSLLRDDRGDYTANLENFTQEEEVKLLKMLNDLGFAFSVGGMAIGPSDAFAHYRKKNLLSGMYKEIEWRGGGGGGGVWIIRER